MVQKPSSLGSIDFIILCINLHLIHSIILVDMAESEVEMRGNPLTGISNWIMDKFRNIIGVEFAEFGGIRQLSIINVVNPSEIPTMLVDLQDKVHTTLVIYVYLF
jgi:hypothetical protein